MPIEDFWTRSSIWLALVFYAVSVVIQLLSHSQRTSESRYADNLARMTWTLGCLCYMAHVGLAFQIHHGWSHKAATLSTMEQTQSTTGIRTGVGIYVNYFFTLVWVFDASNWWIAGVKRYAARRRITTALLHGFFLFMIFNGAIVFATGPARYLGIAVIFTVVVAYIRFNPKLSIDRKRI